MPGLNHWLYALSLGPFWIICVNVKVFPNLCSTMPIAVLEVNYFSYKPSSLKIIDWQL